MLIRYVYAPYGTPSEIIIGEGRAFNSQEMKDHCAEWGIYPDYISPENHKSNGLAEVTVRMLHEHFRKLPEERLHHWDQELLKIQFAFANVPLADLGISPL